MGIVLKNTSGIKSMRSEEPLVSVIVITYNQCQYIEKALDSILMQKVNFSYEILMGDDASTDGTTAILYEYSQRYPQIRLFHREKNLGPPRNAYELLIKARGKYTATCEGDDYWTDPYKMQKQVDVLETDSTLVGCAHGMTIVDDKGRTVKSRHLDWIIPKKRFSLDDFKGILCLDSPLHSLGETWYVSIIWILV